MVQMIIVAAGIELRDHQGSALLSFLNANAHAYPGSVWLYPKGPVAKATHEVNVVYTMAEFAKALDTDDAYVIYEGHSRYGQGPAFGPANTPHVPDIKAFPVNPWGVHFRMGYDATDTGMIGDLLDYSVNPAEYDLLTTPAKAFLPGDLQSAASQAKAVEKRRKDGRLSHSEKKRPCTIAGAWRPLDICDPTLAAKTTTRGEQPLKGRHYYTRHPDKRVRYPVPQPLTAVEVGSADLDKSSLTCKVLFMASCESYAHYFKPLDKRRKVVKSACKFYLTWSVPIADHAKNFIEQVFKGYDPTRTKDSTAILKFLNGVPESGRVGVY
jgi:hypothetical protein